MPRPLLDLTGQKFGYLTAIRRTPLRNDGYAVWVFECMCGQQVTRSPRHVKSAAKIGRTSSCGCYLAKIRTGHKWRSRA